LKFKFVIEVEVKNAGPVQDLNYDEIATILFNMIREPQAPWIIETDVYEVRQQKG
jgi:hypothetical protein